LPASIGGVPVAKQPGGDGHKVWRNILLLISSMQLSERISVSEGGKSKKLSKQRALLKSLAAKAIKGDARAMNILLNLMIWVLEWVSAAFRDAGVNYETSPLPKSSLYLEALPSFNRGAVSIPNHDRLLRELRGLERRVHRSGRYSVDHGSHGSDDFANSLCGCLYIAVHETRRPKMMVGYGGPGGCNGGRIHWEEDERQHSRVQIVHMSEREWIEAKEKEHMR
jgi:Family of unknown function (DUF5681)